MSRTVTFATTRTRTIAQPVRTVSLVESSRQVTIQDSCRTITFTKPTRQLSIVRNVRDISLVRAERTITFAEGPRGPAGAPGVGVDQILGTFVLGETIGSSAAVHIAADGLAYKADRTLNRRADGFTVAGASSGASLEITRIGELSGLTGKTVGVRQWLSSSGQITETIPTSGLLQEVGIARDDSTVFFEPSDATVLA